MKLADEPLTQGPKALHEGVLLGRALLGHDASAVESRVLVNEAWEAARLPHRDVTVRASMRQVEDVIMARTGLLTTTSMISSSQKTRPPLVIAFCLSTSTSQSNYAKRKQ